MSHRIMFHLTIVCLRILQVNEIIVVGWRGETGIEKWFGGNTNRWTGHLRALCYRDKL